MAELDAAVPVMSLECTETIEDLDGDGGGLWPNAYRQSSGREDGGKYLQGAGDNFYENWHEGGTFFDQSPPAEKEPSGEVETREAAAAAAVVESEMVELDQMQVGCGLGFNLAEWYDLSLPISSLHQDDDTSFNIQGLNLGDSHGSGDFAANFAGAFPLIPPVGGNLPVPSSSPRPDERGEISDSGSVGSYESDSQIVPCSLGIEASNGNDLDWNEE